MLRNCEATPQTDSRMRSPVRVPARARASECGPHTGFQALAGASA